MKEKRKWDACCVLKQQESNTVQEKVDNEKTFSFFFFGVGSCENDC